MLVVLVRVFSISYASFCRVDRLHLISDLAESDVIGIKPLLHSLLRVQVGGHSLSKSHVNQWEKIDLPPLHHTFGAGELQNVASGPHEAMVIQDSIGYCVTDISTGMLCQDSPRLFCRIYGLDSVVAAA